MSDEVQRLHRDVGAFPTTQVTLLDLVDRLLDQGVVIHGDITLAVADIDLVYVGLRAVVASVDTINEP